MNRKEFLDRLAFLLQDIDDAERNEALLYYEDYFIEAGIENEQQVIKELGSPEKIAAIIRDGITDNFYENIEYGDQGMRSSAYDYNQEVIRKDSNHNNQHKSPFQGNPERNKILLIFIVIGLFLLLLPLGSSFFGVVLGIVIGILALSLGILLGSVGCVIGAIVCFIKGMLIFSSLPGASLIVFAVGFLLIALSVGFFYLSKMLVKVIPYVFNLIVDLLRSLINKVGEWYEKK